MTISTELINYCEKWKCKKCGDNIFNARDEIVSWLRFAIRHYDAWTPHELRPYRPKWCVPCEQLLDKDE